MLKFHGKKKLNEKILKYILVVFASISIFTLFTFIVKTWYESKDGIIYDKCIVLDKIEGNDIKYVNKKYVDSEGCWIRFKRESNGYVYDRFYNNPFIIRSYEIGKTYQSEFRLKGHDVVENSMTSLILVIFMIIDIALLIVGLELIGNKFKEN